MHPVVCCASYHITKYLSVQSEVQMSQMHKAAREGDAGRLKELLELGIDPNSVDKLFRTPIHLAVWAGNVDIIKILLDNAATDINALASDDFTPLHFAVTSKGDQADVIKTLTGMC